MRASELERWQSRQGEIVNAHARVGGELRELVIPSAIPDSVLLQYDGGNYSGGDSEWQDDTGTNDMVLTGGESETTVNSNDAVAFDGTDDYGLIDMEAIDHSLNEWTLEFVYSSTTNERNRIFGWEDGDNRLGIGPNRDNEFDSDSGNAVFRLRDPNDTRLSFDPGRDDLFDGDQHAVTWINDGSTQNGQEVIIDGTEQSLNFFNADSPDMTAPDRDLAVAGSDNGPVESLTEIDFVAIRWHDKAIEGQTITDMI